jgi:hypothetical protein
MRNTSKVLPSAAVLAVGLSVCVGAVAATAASPFLPDAKPAPQAAPAMDAELQALQLSGISAIGDEVQFNLVDPRTKKSYWLALGATEGGITVVSYEADADAVVVRKGAQTRRLELRQSRIVASAPTSPAVPAPTPAAPLDTTNVVGVDEIKNPTSPQEIKQAEFEARMLVSDLLEISMRERARQKALREAKQREQAGGTP